MRTVTLEDLIARVREEADMKDSDFIEDSELIRMINEQHTILRGLLLTSLGDISLFTTEVALAPDADGYITLPDDVLIIKSIHYSDGGRSLEALPFYNEEYAPDTNFHREHFYVLIGNKIRLVQRKDASIRVTYSVAPTYLVALTDTLDVMFNEDTVIALLTAKEALRREETSLQDINSSIDLALKALTDVLRQRDVASPHRITNKRRRSSRNSRYGELL